MMRNIFLIPVLSIFITAVSYGQTRTADRKLPDNATLDQVIDFALENKIELKQADIDKEIGEREIASALSGWFPQIEATGSIVRNIQIPIAIIDGNVIQMGQRNTGNLTFRADQAILSPTLLQASRAAKFVRQQNDQNIEDTEINTVVDVSKAYYDILTSEESINIIKENILRLERQLSEARVQYEVGLVDKTDYKRAQISLNNSKAELKTSSEMRDYKYDYLKMLVGLHPRESISLSFEDESMESNILLDTTENLTYANRVEYRQTETLRNIQKLNTQFQKWQFLPQLGAYGLYNANYFNNQFSNLFSNNFPSSSVGLSLTMPIFTGTKRIQEIRKSELQEKRVEWDLKNLENQISAEYSAGMASYRSNMNEWRNSKDNMDLSEDVYNTIKLQYDAGIKTYLDLMTAETDLKTSQINYLNALYAVLSSKLDIQKALGTVDIARN